MEDEPDIYMTDPHAKTVFGIIQALKIIYAGKLDTKWPIQAEHDVLYVGGDHISQSSDDGKKLHALGFHWDESADCWAYFT